MQETIHTIVVVDAGGFSVVPSSSAIRLFSEWTFHSADRLPLLGSSPQSRSPRELSVCAEAESSISFETAPIQSLYTEIGWMNITR